MGAVVDCDGSGVCARKRLRRAAFYPKDSADGWGGAHETADSDNAQTDTHANRKAQTDTHKAADGNAPGAL